MHPRSHAPQREAHALPLRVAPATRESSRAVVKAQYSQKFEENKNTNLKSFIHINGERKCHTRTHMCCAVLSHLSCVQLFETLWTVTHQAPVHGILQARTLEWVAISFSRDLPTQGLNPRLWSLMCQALADGLFTTSTTWETYTHKYI